MQRQLIHWATAVALVAAVTALGACTRVEPSTTGELAVEEMELSTLRPRQVSLPNALTSVKFAVIGDSGRGSREQREVAEEMTRWRMRFAFDFVVMLGDNIYEAPAGPEDYRRKFEEPYAELLDAGVDFFAVLGNHDDVREVDYPPFHMKGQRYYTFTPPADLIAKLATRIEFFALDTTQPNGAQLAWLDDRLAGSNATWKIVLSHHPLYTTGRYRSTARVYRHLLEPTLLRGGADAVFSGHEHIYQRLRPQRGVQYFVSGGAGSVRVGEGAPSPLVARTFASDLHFMLIEAAGDELHFQTISRRGVTVDAGFLKTDRGEEATAGDRAVPERSRRDAP